MKLIHRGNGKVNADDVLVVTYLLSCFIRSGTDLSSFKKLGATEKKTTLRQLWSERMMALEPKFQTAAYIWAGVSRAAGAVRPFWDHSDTPPSVISIPHLAAQDIIDRVCPIILYADTVS
jgi:hypothetical protein